MKIRNTLAFTAMTLVGLQTSASAASVALVGTDFSDSAVFGAIGGTYDGVNFDDFDATDGITVSTWDATAQSRLSLGENIDLLDNSAKLNGDDANNSTTPLPNGTVIAGGSWTAAFTLSIDIGKTLNLDSIDFVSQVATTTTNGRWLVFGSSQDSGEVVWNVQPEGRENTATSSTIDLTGSQYQNLTGDVTFYWAAGGPGSGDIEFDNIVVNGTVAVTEAASAALLGLGGLALILRRRK